MLIHLVEHFTNNLNITYLNIYGFIAAISGLYVILTKNPIVSVLFLIFLFLGISTYLMFLGLNFIGLSYLLVYVGAVSILFLFILMLINVRISEIVTTTLNSVPLALTIGTLYFVAFSKVLPGINPTLNLNFKSLFKSFFSNNTENSNIILEASKKAEDLKIYKADRSFFELFSNISKHELNSNSENFKFIGTPLPRGLGYGEKIQSPVPVTPKAYPADSAETAYSAFTDNLYPNTNVNLTSVFVWDNLMYTNYYINSIGNILYLAIPIWLILTSLVLLLAMVGCILITVNNKGEKL